MFTIYIYICISKFNLKKLMLLVCCFAEGSASKQNKLVAPFYFKYTWITSIIKLYVAYGALKKSFTHVITKCIFKYKYYVKWTISFSCIVLMYNMKITTIIVQRGLLRLHDIIYFIKSTMCITYYIKIRIYKYKTT